MTISNDAIHNAINMARKSGVVADLPLVDGDEAILAASELDKDRKRAIEGWLLTIENLYQQSMFSTDPAPLVQHLFIAGVDTYVDPSQQRHAYTLMLEVPNTQVAVLTFDGDGLKGMTEICDYLYKYAKMTRLELHTADLVGVWQRVTNQDFPRGTWLFYVEQEINWTPEQVMGTMHQIREMFQ